MNYFILITPKINKAINTFIGAKTDIWKHNVANHVLNTYIIEKRDNDTLYFKFTYNDVNVCISLPVKKMGTDFIFKYGNDDKMIQQGFKDIIIKLAKIEKLKNEIKEFRIKQ